MREIKFRAWLIGSERMLENVGFDNTSKAGAVVEYMQYTGLKDKNGVEIYEGDIVQYIYRDGYVKKLRLVEWRGMRQYTGFSIAQPKHAELEIIGNIYEHPELVTPNPKEEDK